MEVAVRELKRICAESGGKSQFFEPRGSTEAGYKQSVEHYYDSSSDIAQYAVQPGSVEDLAKMVKILKDRRVDFAVQGGGHNSNPGFSSTRGIHVSMARFNRIHYIKHSESVEVEAGCVFPDIYRKLEEVNRSIVGGDATRGVGVAGWLLGGGYSMRTNQFGLGIDRIESFQIVLPSSEIVDVTEFGEYSDLFIAVKGGGNNFGIVTKFTLKTHYQGKVYGGVLEYSIAQADEVKRSIMNFINGQQFPRAAMVAHYRYAYNGTETKSKLTVQCYYNGPSPPYGLFQGFLAIDHKGGVNSVGENVEPGMMSFADLDDMMSRAHDFTPQVEPMMIGNRRSRWGNVMISKYTPALIDVIREQATVAGNLMAANGGLDVITEVWPFLPNMFRSSRPAAWPHEGQANSPVIVIFIWAGAGKDAFWIEQMKTALAAIRAVAVQEGVANPRAPVYLNTALAETTTVEDVYRYRLPWLRDVRRKYDPDNFMGKAGGFRIPLPDAVLDESDSKEIAKETNRLKQEPSRREVSGTSPLQALKLLRDSLLSNLCL